jgi:1-phosphofructokinase family hexose kinase
MWTPFPKLDKTTVVLYIGSVRLSPHKYADFAHLLDITRVQGVSLAEKGRIITIGLSPAWDIRCRGAGLDWGRHVEIDEQVVRPAGKALNVSYALAWMGRASVAAGLWGREDHGQMRNAVRRLGGQVRTSMTTGPGSTRRNITVVDTLRHREMHLRLRSELASQQTLRRLRADLKKLVRGGDTCVFAGAMPGDPLLEQVVDLVDTCHNRGACIVVDTHGPALAGVVDAGLASVISPNVEELRELLHQEVANMPARLASAARRLLERVSTVLISRGVEGAVVVTKAGAWTGRSRVRREALSTVGCGDYLLAGFLAGLQDAGDPQVALATGLKVATARAWGLTETKAWPQTDSEIGVSIRPL